MQQQRHKVSRTSRETSSVPTSSYKRTSNKPASFLQLAFTVSGCLSVLRGLHWCIHIPPGKQKAFLLYIWLFWPSTKLPFGSCAICLHPCRICLAFLYTYIHIYIYIRYIRKFTCTQICKTCVYLRVCIYIYIYIFVYASSINPVCPMKEQLPAQKGTISTEIIAWALIFI